MTDRVWRLLLGFAATIIVIAGLRAASNLLIPVVVAGLLALVSFPLVTWLRARSVPTVGAVLLTVLLVVAVIAGPAAIVTAAATRFGANVPQYRAALTDMSASTFEWLAEQGLLPAAPLVDPGAILDWMTFAVTGLATLLSNLFLILLIMAFILLEAAELRPKLRAAFGMSDREIGRLSGSSQQVYDFVWLKTIVSVATGLLAGVWVAVLGIDFAVLWGLLAFLLNYIPNFGSLIAAIPPVLLGLIQYGPGSAVLVGIGYVALNIVVGSVLEPRLMGRRLGISPLALLVSLVFWGWLWGAVGLLLAVPMTMAIRVVFEDFEQLRWLAVLIARAPREEQAEQARTVDRETEVPRAPAR